MKVTYNRIHGFATMFGTITEFNKLDEGLGDQINAYGGVVAADTVNFGMCVLFLNEVKDILTEEEIEAVLAHEEGHLVLKHQLQEDLGVNTKEHAADMYAIHIKGVSTKALATAVTKICHRHLRVQCELYGENDYMPLFTQIMFSPM